MVTKDLEDNDSYRIAIVAKGKLRVTPDIPDEVASADKSRTVPLQKTTVFDFMPPIVGDQYRRNLFLSKRLFRDPPVTGPFMAMNQAYMNLAKQALETEDITAALEAYKFALDSDIQFTKAIARAQSISALSAEETIHINTGYDEMGKSLATKLEQSGVAVDQDAYYKWVDESREAYEAWLKLNQTEFGSFRYIEACLNIGRSNEALSLAENSKKRDKILITKTVSENEFDSLLKKIRLSNPTVELLDVDYLRSFINDYEINHEFGSELDYDPN